MPVSAHAPFVLLVARHGATHGPGAIAGFNAADDDAPLTAAGEAQAEALADAMTEVLGSYTPQTVALHHSPRKRAKQTLCPLATRLSWPTHETAVLDELNYGRWAGQPKATLATHEAAALWDWDHSGIEPPASGFVPGAKEADAQTHLWAEGRAQSGHALLLVSHSGRLRSFYGLGREPSGRRAKMSVGHVGLLVRGKTPASWQRWAWDLPPRQALACWRERLANGDLS